MHILPAITLMQAAFSAFVHQKGIGIADDVILFDAPAFADPANPSSMLASFDTFAFKRQIDINSTVTVITLLLSAFGISVGDSVSNLANRARLFAATGRAGKSIELNVQNCTRHVILSETAGFPDRGLFNKNVSIGTCNVQSNSVSSATVVLSASDNRTISSNIFFYANSGFGVISDVDDTIKVTNVLNTGAMLKATFLDDPVPVTGMPELYNSLAQTFSSDFFYVSGSMLQIYPFLHDFIHTTYAASKGPLFLRNLTDILDIVNFQSNGVYAYKLRVIDQIKGMYPNKQFLAIGDSTQKDPETYGEAYRKYGDFIICAWILQVRGANNTAARFAAAFKGVPSNRWRIFNESEIATLSDIDVAAGEC